MAKGWDAMSFFVCFWYASKAAAKIVSKFLEEVAVDGTRDIGLVAGNGLDVYRKFVCNRY